MNTLTMARKKKELSPNRQLAQAIIDQYHPQSVEDMQDALESWYRVMQVIMAVHLRFQLFHYHQN